MASSSRQSASCNDAASLASSYSTAAGSPVAVEDAPIQSGSETLHLQPPQRALISAIVFFVVLRVAITQTFAVVAERRETLEELLSCIYMTLLLVLMEVSSGLMAKVCFQLGTAAPLTMRRFSGLLVLL
eukprot:TRINITY_DN95742_c0_g1_i1.p1 TRINITY_DN95742_c0_g1~~TRINITY_DN95742_c0_g1_i1.p1  ORF type:complete len:129 (+),score=21.04 TRINITY_DN95742_c0_g1_i1:87-473(+)